MISPSVKQAGKQAGRQASRQASRQSVSQSVAQPVTQSTCKSLSQSVCQSIYSSLSQPVCQLLNQRVNHSAGKWSAQLETALIEGDVYFNKVMLLFLKNWNIHNKSETCSNTIHCLLCLWKWACALQWLALPFQNNHCECTLLLKPSENKYIVLQEKVSRFGRKSYKASSHKWSLEEYS